ncbi:hypothetical protein AB834_00345 [PVC group bacterium (ex Bugula neritina AB1)]|nr:hypothetical protein AB834_00345 [PVC group bacterium (ex Bugula neritina AB1)]
MLNELRSWNIPKREQSSIANSFLLTQKDFDTLRFFLKNPMRQIMETLYFTGIRVSELTNIRIEDCFEKKYHVEIYIFGKGGKDRKIFLTRNLWRRFNFVEGQKYLFETNTGNPFSRNYIYLRLREYGYRYLKKRVTPHMFRHTFATRKINQTGKIKAVSKYLGHTSAKTTLDMYCHQSLDYEDLF